MDPTASRHRQSSSSSHRLLKIFTSCPPSLATAGDELNEAERFWSSDVLETENQPPLPAKNNQSSLTCSQELMTSGSDWRNLGGFAKWAGED
ncbi:hypothetical protein QN277_021623 [Acacia crassicarpa]|uniref:Uncharacterized protein n=1 Tax=Acacia crassicarpa TaxID=499986 RepID=A0AAE1KGM9_9FABA|nr:hypothetical protein QN277_021623 [Acacia crassicarpa]